MKKRNEEAENKNKKDEGMGRGRNGKKYGRKREGGKDENNHFILIYILNL